MAPALKVLLRFREPFWPRRASFIVLDRSFPVWPAGDPHPVLVAFITGARATALAPNPVAGCLDALASSFGREVRDLLVASDVADWTADPWTRGGYSTVPPGATDARHRLAEPLGALHFAGEATDLAAPGTVGGALRSGERAADEIAATARPPASAS